MASLKRRRTGRVIGQWKEEMARRRNNNKALAGRRRGEEAGMTDEEKPKFSKELQNVSKAVEAPSHQMLSGHAMAATFLKE